MRSLRRFHNAGRWDDGLDADLMARELGALGFDRLMPWSRGVDEIQFNPGEARSPGTCRNRSSSTQGVSPPKRTSRPSSGWISRARRSWRATGRPPTVCAAPIPDVHFLGVRKGEDLARVYASADVFVFPSRTDTFGMVLLEAMASGLPIAAFPVPGPLDVIGGSGAGVLDEDLRAACLGALEIPRERGAGPCRDLHLGACDGAVP